MFERDGVGPGLRGDVLVEVELAPAFGHGRVVAPGRVGNYPCQGDGFGRENRWVHRVRFEAEPRGSGLPSAIFPQFPGHCDRKTGEAHPQAELLVSGRQV